MDGWMVGGSGWVGGYTVSEYCYIHFMLTLDQLDLTACLYFADQLYPFGDAVGDAAVPSGIALDTTSPPLTLSPRFRFFGRDEGTIHVSYRST